MNICVIGSGYVGLVTGACFAELGHKVICIDNDTAKIKKIKAGAIPFFEPGLKELVAKGKRKGKLSFGSRISEGVKRSEVVFIAVGTPSRDSGEADLSFVENVSRQIAQSMTSYKLIVEKSTVPVNTGEWVENVIKIFNKRRVEFDVASNPEFLREGSAIEDFMNPDRIVVGAKSKKARDIMSKLYKGIDAPIVFTDIRSAEIIKHASNSFLAAKISFINAVANICDLVGADVAEVSRGVGLDKRVGAGFLNAGAGFGGSCFPKDLSAFILIAEKLGYNFGLLKEVQKINEQQKKSVIKKIETLLWNLPKKTITVLGLSFKPDTDDLRQAPSIDIISMLKKEGARVKTYDPQAMDKAKKILGKGVEFCRDPYSACRNSDCVLVITEWKEFRDLNFNRIKKLMTQPVLVDGRNMYDPERMRKLGFRYAGMGRK